MHICVCVRDSARTYAIDMAANMVQPLKQDAAASAGPTAGRLVHSRVSPLGPSVSIDHQDAENTNLIK